MNAEEYEKKKNELQDKINELSSQLHKLREEHDTTMLDDAKAMFEGKWLYVTTERNENGTFVKTNEFTLYYIDKLFLAKKQDNNYMYLQASCIEVIVEDDVELGTLKLSYDTHLTDDYDAFYSIYLRPCSRYVGDTISRSWKILDDEEAKAILAVNVSKMENLFKQSGRK